MARKKLETLTEQMYYVLLSLRAERHGYGVMQDISGLRGPCTPCWSVLKETD